MKLIFCMQINNQYYRMIPSILMGMARPAKITRNNKFAKSLQYLKKEVRDETDFLCRWASQFSINWCYHFTQNNRYAMSLQYLKKALSYEVKVLQVDSIFFLMGLPRHAQSTRVNLHYFDDILRKKSGIKFDLFKYYSYNLLYIQYSPTIDPFPLSIWNPYPYPFHHLIVCLI